MPLAKDRRRTLRVRPGPLRVRLHRQCEGTLIDISEGGALVSLPTAQAPNKQVTLHVEWDGTMLSLPARVVRTISQRLQLAGAVLARTEHLVAMEFVDVPAQTAATLRHLIERC